MYQLITKLQTGRASVRRTQGCGTSLTVGDRARARALSLSPSLSLSLSLSPSLSLSLSLCRDAPVFPTNITNIAQILGKSFRSTRHSRSTSSSTASRQQAIPSSTTQDIR
jgi:hypothetical protein